jgi:hypothetical protein
MKTRCSSSLLLCRVEWYHVLVCVVPLPLQDERRQVQLNRARFEAHGQTKSVANADFLASRILSSRSGIDAARHGVTSTSRFWAPTPAPDGYDRMCAFRAWPLSHSHTQSPSCMHQLCVHAISSIYTHSLFSLSLSLSRFLAPSHLVHLSMAYIMLRVSSLGELVLQARCHDQRHSACGLWVRDPTSGIAAFLGRRGSAAIG